jgi:transposase, IS5 family
MWLRTGNGCCTSGPRQNRINAVLAAAGYNFGLLLRWLAELLRALIAAIAISSPKPRSA